MPTTGEELSLYFHIPFCRQKCHYCHFYVIPDKPAFQQRYILALEKEFQIKQPLFQNKRLISIYFGGGTPSLLKEKHLETILSWISKSFSYQDIEITLEANPEDVSLEKMSMFYRLGINRISIGIQAFNNALLKQLGRNHDLNRALKAIDQTYQSGINNITIDLMYDLPTQSPSLWEETLQYVAKLPITHLSLYNLSIEPHTVFYKYRKKISQQMPNEADSLAMYQQAIDTLQQAGFDHYEISAFAKEGFQSKHNSGYWTGRSFLGLGPSACSYLNGSRFQNIANLNRYDKALKNHQSILSFQEKLSLDQALREQLVIQLRLLKGIELNAFEKRHGIFSQKTLASIDSLISDHLLVNNNGTLKLTKKGLYFHDTIADILI